MREKTLIKLLIKEIKKEYNKRNYNYTLTAKTIGKKTGFHPQYIGKVLTKIDIIKPIRQRKGRCFLWRTNL